MVINTIKKKDLRNSLINDNILPMVTELFMLTWIFRHSNWSLKKINDTVNKNYNYPTMPILNKW